MNRLASKFQDLSARQEKAFVPYIMAGDGGLDSLADKLKMLERFGASAIEVGIPFSDPVADGKAIQEAGLRSLKQGTTLKDTLRHIGEARSAVSIPIIIMTYLNPILAYGIDQFCADGKSAGVDGCIIPDMPAEEEALVEPYLSSVGIELIRLVTLTTPIARIRDISEKGSGFLYAVTVKGVTGERDGFQSELHDYLVKVKQASKLPVLAGFGVANNEQAKELASFCDGVIAGSKIIELFHENRLDELQNFVSSFKSKRETSV
ncbi:tryptophan synthase subunit alpha [Bacillus sp. B-jedd]|uniref:tryptophan synthase subunit alpha n=1 Tax=Bacillus sp. B-jedd TaxID=1476857 RepID=UPI0005155BEE|nr:tryptophan synthase subunit alpha [Bacillus sp. B-jedd]CEG27497.1 tryptophan synthase subunit alpha [Bacillus sp. B-jedd]